LSSNAASKNPCSVGKEENAKEPRYKKFILRSLGENRDDIKIITQDGRSTDIIGFLEQVGSIFEGWVHIYYAHGVNDKEHISYISQL